MSATKTNRAQTKGTKISYSIRTRRGLKLLAGLVRNESVFAAAIVDNWKATSVKDLKRALAWIDSQPVHLPQKKRKERVKP